MTVFRVQARRTRKGTHGMILAMAKYGNWYPRQHPKTDADVKRMYQQVGYDFRKVVEGCIDKDAGVPGGLENLAPATWNFVSSGGAQMTFTDESGEETVVAQGDARGTVSEAAYWTLFDQAASDFERCLNSGEHGTSSPACPTALRASRFT